MTAVSCALIRPTARAMSWVPLLAACAAGLAVVAVPAATAVRLMPEDLTMLLRVAAVCGSAGAAFVLDDPAAGTVEAAPTPVLLRRAIRTALAAPVLACWWTAAAWVTRAGAEEGVGAGVPVRGLALEAAALVAAALALAVLAARLSGDGLGGVAAAPALLALVGAVAFLPGRAALFVPPGDARWAANHRIWTVLLVAALATAVWGSREPTSRRRRQRRRNERRTGEFSVPTER